MKKLYNNIITIRALMLVILTSFFAFGAQAQFAIAESPTPGDFHYTNEQDTIKIDTTGTDFSDDIVFYLYTADFATTDFSDDQIIGQSNASDTAIVFNWKYLDGNNEAYFISGSTNRGTNSTADIDESMVSIPGQDYNTGGIYGNGTFEMDQTGFRRLTTDAISELATTEDASLFVPIRLGFVTSDDSILVEYTINGTDWNILTDTNDSSYFASTYLGGSDFRTLEFELPANAKNANTQFRIRQTRSDYEAFDDEWYVGEDNFRVEIGSESYSGPVSVNTYSVTNPSTGFVSVTDSAGGNPGNFRAGQPIIVNASFTGYEDQVSEYDYTVVFQDGNQSFRLESEDVGTISKTENPGGEWVHTFEIEGTIPASIEYDNTWTTTIRAYTGSSATLGFEDEFVEGVERGSERFTVDGGQINYDNNPNPDTVTSVSFDSDFDRSYTTEELTIETVANAAITLNISKTSNGLSPSGTEVVIEYSTDGAEYTQIGDAISLNDTLDADIVRDVSSITALASTTTQFRIRQLSNNGAGLDTWEINKFEFSAEGDILVSGNPVEYDENFYTLIEPDITLDPVDVPDDLIYPGDELTLTYNIFPGAFTAGTEIMAILDGTNVDYVIGTSTAITAGENQDLEITITVPPIVGGDYSITLQTMGGAESNSVTLPVFNTEVLITEVSSDNGVTDGTTDVIYPGDQITASYDITGTVGSGAELFFEVLDQGDPDTNDDDEWVVLSSATGADIDGTISGTLPSDVNFDDPTATTDPTTGTNYNSPIVRVRIGNGLLAQTSSSFATDLDDLNIDTNPVQFSNENNNYYIFDIFDEELITGNDPNSIGDFISSGERSISTIPFNMPFGGSIQIWFTEQSFDFNQTVLLQASNDGETFTTIFEDTYEGGNLRFNDQQYTDLPESLYGDSVVFRVIYNEDGEASEFENEIRIDNIVVLVNDFSSANSDVFSINGQFRRPRVTLEEIDANETNFIVGEEVSFEYTTEGTFPANTAFALIFVGERDDEVYGEVVATSSTTGAGTFTFNVPMYAYDFDGTDTNLDIWDNMEIVAYDATDGADFVLDDEIIVDDEEDQILVIEGGAESNFTDGRWEFGSAGDRSLLTQAFDLSGAQSVTLEFDLDLFDGLGAMSNVLTLPQLQVSIDAGQTFVNLAAIQDSPLDDGYLYLDDDYSIEIPAEYVTTATHFRWYQALNLGENDDEWAVQDITIILDNGNEISTFYTAEYDAGATTTEEPISSVSHPDVDNEFELTQVDPNDAVFNGETVELTFDPVYETTVGFPSGTTFEYYLYDNSFPAGYVIDPTTDEPYLMASADAVGAFTATVPSYVENGTYEIHLRATIAIDEEFADGGIYYYYGDATSGYDNVGTLDVFLRAAKTTLDFDENDVLYAGSTVTFNFDLENAETNSADNANIFSNLLIRDYDGNDDLLIATQEGIATSFTVDLPPFVRSTEDFVIELSENAPLGEPLDLIGDSDLSNIEDDFEDNFISGAFPDQNYYTRYIGNENDINIRDNDAFGDDVVRFNYSINNSSNKDVFIRIRSRNASNSLNVLTTQVAVASGLNQSGFVEVDTSDFFEGRDLWIEFYTSGVVEGSININSVSYRDASDNSPSTGLTNDNLWSQDGLSFSNSPGEIEFTNTSGRGLITTRDFEADELSDATLLEFTLDFNEVPENMVENQFLILEYSTDNGGTYTQLDTLPFMDEENPIDGERYLVTLPEEVKSNGARFRWRQEERAGIEVGISDISFLFGSLLPFDYIAETNVEITSQSLLVTSINTTEACLDEEFEVGFEVRGRMGMDNIVQLEYANAFNTNWSTLADEFNAFEGTGSINVTLPANVVSENGDNESFKFRLTYEDGTFGYLDYTGNSYSGTGAESEQNVEIVAPVDRDANFFSLNGDPLACEGDDVIIQLNNPQDYFMYELLDQDGNVLGTTTYDPDVDSTNQINIGSVAEFTTLSLQVTSMSMSGNLTCNTLISSRELEVEPLANYELYSNNGGAGQFRLAAAGQTVQVCENQNNTILELGRLRADGGIDYNPGNVEWFVNDLNNPVSTEADLEANDLTVAGSYFARITTGSCEYITESISIEIVESPDQPEITVVSGTLETCNAADTVVLGAPDGFEYYRWSNGETTQQIEIAEADFGDNYTVQVSNLPFGIGCASPSSAAVTVTRYDLPILSIADNTNAENNGGFIGEGDEFEACDGGFTVRFYDDEDYGIPGGNIEIFRDGASVGFAQNTSAITLDESGTYSFTWSNDDNVNIDCSVSTVSFTLNIVEIPDTPELTASGDLAFCQTDGEVTLTAPTGFTKYYWYRNGGLINGAISDNFDDSNNSITVSTTGRYTVRVGNLANCTSNSSNYIDVEARTAPPIVTASQIDGSCGAGTVTFSLFGDATYTYQLINAETGAPSGNAVRGQDGTIYLVSEEIDERTEFYIETSYADGSGCTNSNPDIEFFGENNNAVLEIDGTTLSVNISDWNDRLETRWYRNGIELRNRVNATSITVMDAAEYSVEVDFASGCTITSNAVTIENNANASVQTYFGELDVTSYPNPSTDVLNVSMKGGGLGTYDISITSMSGQIIISKTIEKTSEEQVEQLDVQSLDNGIYNLRIQRGDSVENFRIVKQ